MLFTKVRVDVDGGMTAVGEGGREREEAESIAVRTHGRTDVEGEPFKGK